MPVSGFQRLMVSMTALAVCAAIVLVAQRAGSIAWPERAPRAAAIAPIRDPRPSTARQVETLQSRLRQNPESVRALAELGQLYLQQARETGDPAYYPRAEAALRQALARDERNVDALVGMGELALARHQFHEALTWGERARAVAPELAVVYGLIGDAQIELGQYPEAVASFQKMDNLRPDLSSFSRISYARELHGQVDAAIDAMQRAARVGGQGQESTAWARVQLGHLYFNTGALDQARAEYEQALREAPDYLHALAGLGRVAAARGDYAAATAHYQRATKSIPLPEYVIALGDVYTAAGRQAEADEQYALARVQAQLLAANGVNSDLELALFAADHPQAAGMSPEQVVAQARAALAQRPSIYAHDVLAWALYRAGDYADAQEQITAALRLGTQDALLHYHAGAIARARGDEAAARDYFAQALRINPYFSLLYAPDARAAVGR